MKEEILEGLKTALAKGDTLQQAMQSFYNAGYEINEIQNAAKELQMIMPQLTLQQPKSNIQNIKQKIPFIKSSQSVNNLKPIVNQKPIQISPNQEIPSIKTDPIIEDKKKPLQVVSNYEDSPQNMVSSNVNSVSDYNEKQKNPRKVIVVIIIVLLVMLLMALVGIFFFRESILGLLDTMFTTQ